MYDVSVPCPEYVGTDEQAKALLRKSLEVIEDPDNLIGYDTETHGKKLPIKSAPLDPVTDTVTFWSLSFKYRGEYGRWCLPVKYLTYFSPLLENKKTRIAGWNIKYDAHVGWNCGIDIFQCGAAIDGVSLAQTHDENRHSHGLKSCAPDWIGINMTSYLSLFDGIRDSVGNKVKEYVTSLLELVELGFLSKVTDYASLDAYAHLRLVEWLIEKLSMVSIGTSNLWKYFLLTEVPYTRLLWVMERRGLGIDVEYLREQVAPIEKEIEALEKKICNRVGRLINIQSPVQLAEYFFGEKGLGLTPLKVTGKGSASVDEEVMNALVEAGVNVAQDILTCRHLNKIKGTYMDTLITLSDYYPDHRIHPSFNQLGARTGRLSSMTPNSTNIPRPDNDEWGIRRSFVPQKKYVYICADYEQVEMRIMAHMCLHRNIPVSAPGRAVEIGKIVQQRMNIPVYSMDIETGKKVVKNVVGHYKNEKPVEDSTYKGGMRPEDWVVIRHEGAPWRKLIVTKEHIVYTPSGKVSVESLQEGDYLFYEEPRIKGAQEQLLIGTILGDGNFKRSHSPTGLGYFESINFYQGEDQKEYFNFKRRVLGPLVLSHGSRYTRGFSSKKLRIGKIGASFQISKMYRIMYDGNNECPTKEAIDKLDGRGLSTWYCDDGTIQKDKRCFAHKGFTACICSQVVTEERMNDLNEKFCLRFSKHKRGIGVSGQRAEDFFSIIAGYVPHSMRYKLPEHWRHVPFKEEEWLEPVDDITPVQIIEKRKGSPSDPCMGCGSGSKYDITVADTHNYFAAGVLVSNSGDERMLGAIQENKDLHSFTVSKMVPGVTYEEVVEAKKSKEPNDRQKWLKIARQDNKAVGFGIIYGAGPPTISEQIQISEADWQHQVNEMSNKELSRKVERLMRNNPLLTEQKAVELAGRYAYAALKIENYFKVFPRVKTYMERIPLECKTEMIRQDWQFDVDPRFPGARMLSPSGHMKPFGFVRTLSGRLRRLEDIDGNGPNASEAKRQAVNCLDYETEALTQRGWVKGPNLLDSDVLLTKSLERGVLEWQKVQKVHLFPDYEGLVVHFKSKTFEAVTTPEHRWMVYNKSTGKDECKTSEGLSVWGDHRIHRTGLYQPEVSNREPKYTNDFVELCGWVLTDGYFKKQKNWHSTGVGVCQSLRGNPEKVKSIDDLFTRLEYKVGRRVVEWSQCVYWEFFNELGEKLRTLFPARVITPEFLLDITPEQAQLLLRTMLLGDGWEQQSRTSFCCRDQARADAFQTLCTLCGIATTSQWSDMRKYHPKSSKMMNVPVMNGYFRIALLRRDKVQVTKDQVRVYGAKIPMWCPTVPNGFFVARRSGKVFVTGNSTIQGSAADIIKAAMLRISDDEELTLLGVEIVNQIHDELTIEVPEGNAEIVVPRIKEFMEHPFYPHEALVVPIPTDIKIVHNWAEGK
jgi:DNA polymerase I-like protein with 3'-5' exonuclease and polymerase domains